MNRQKAASAQQHNVLKHVIDSSLCDSSLLFLSLLSLRRAHCDCVCRIRSNSHPNKWSRGGGKSGWWDTFISSHCRCAARGENSRWPECWGWSSRWYLGLSTIAETSTSSSSSSAPASCYLLRHHPRRWCPLLNTDSNFCRMSRKLLPASTDP